MIDYSWCKLDEIIQKKFHTNKFFATRLCFDSFLTLSISQLVFFCLEKFSPKPFNVSFIVENTKPNWNMMPTFVGTRAVKKSIDCDKKKCKNTWRISEIFLASAALSYRVFSRFKQFLRPSRTWDTINILVICWIHGAA